MDYAAGLAAPFGGPAPALEKSSQLLIRDYPQRAIAIVSQSHALIFRHSSSEAPANGSLAAVQSAGRARGGGADLTAQCMVEFSPASKKLLVDYRPLSPRPIYGTLGLIAVNGDDFVCVITHATRVATLRPGETVERILNVEFYCLNTPEYDNIYSVDPLDPDNDASAYYHQGLNRREVPIEHPCLELQKLLSNGSFYYSTDFDLTNRLQDRPADASTFDIDNFDESFLWNSFMVSPLVQFRSRLLPNEREALDASRILTSAIRGFCLTMTIPQTTAPLGAAKFGMPSYLSVISRLSCKRAGTRFNSRGIDDDGNVANFVETETMYWSPSGVVFSYVQVRGSVPVFWEQAAGLIPGQQKITVTRSRDGTQPAFDKHFEDLEQAYGAVHVLNLLSETKPGELELTQLYRYGIQHCPLSRPGEKRSQDHSLLRETEYDFHAETRGPNGYEAAGQIRHYIEGSADGFAYYLAEETDDVGVPSAGSRTAHRRIVVVLQQEGVFRTNCLDCLDRTNLIQTIVSQMAVEAFLGHRGEVAASDFWMRHSSLWADNGDNLSRIYAGTGALKSSFTRHGKMSLAGAIADARKSATRLYINNFADKGRQNTIDMLLGRLYGQNPVVLYDPISDFVSMELNKRSAEFTFAETISIFVGTFNLNGRTHGIDEDLSPWLCPDALASTLPEIFVVGFQEIVELSPQQIMNSDPTRKQEWEKSVKRALNRHAARFGGDHYVLLRSGQLVGAALCIWVRASVLHNIKNVEGSVKKTGLSGMAGNKGAVAIRLDYADTQICFVTAHLAAGFANYEERNKDYATIHHGLRFQRNRGIDDHDTVIWLGDFNYRIGLSNEEARELVKRKDLKRLYDNDQLNLQMVAGLAFPFYSEARINFMPTYKFDVGRDEYDSSEKARVPAWTDRILRRGTNLRQLSYNSAPLRFSDHRPVYATFELRATITNEQRKHEISRDLYERRKTDVGDDSGANLVADDDSEDEDLIGYDAIEPGLPPASSDRQKWWLDNGKMARSDVTAPRPNGLPNQSTILNPNRSSNPFVPSEEPDWVTVPRTGSRPSSFSSISSSPYEHVHHPAGMLSSSASSSGPRKPPPPFDPAGLPAKIGHLGLADEQAQAQAQAQAQKQENPPPPPPPRRQTGAPGSQTPTMQESVLIPERKPVPKTVPTPHPPKTAPAASSQTAFSPSSQTIAKPKPAPPVAKKPAHLTTTTSPKSSPSISRSNDFEKTLEATLRPLPARQLSRGAHGSPSSNAGPPPGYGHDGASPAQPVRGSARSATSSGRSTPAGAVGLVGLSGGKAGQTGLPVRGGRETPPKAALQMPARQQQQPAMDLLGDDSHMEMGSWETLKPQ